MTHYPAMKFILTFSEDNSLDDDVELRLDGVLAGHGHVAVQQLLPHLHHEESSAALRSRAQRALETVILNVVEEVLDEEFFVELFNHEGRDDVAACVLAERLLEY